MQSYCCRNEYIVLSALAEEETRRYRPTKNYILNRIGQIIIMRLKIWARIGWVVILVLKSSNVLDKTVEKLFLCVSNCTKLLDIFDMLSHAIISVVYLGCTGCYSTQCSPWWDCFQLFLLYLFAVFASQESLKNIFRFSPPFILNSFFVIITNLTLRRIHRRRMDCH